MLQLIETENLDDYNKIKSNIERTRTEFDLLHEENEENRHKLKTFEDFDRDFDDFTKISDDILALHKEKIIGNKNFAEKYALEKKGRYNIRTPLFTIDDRALTEDVGFMQYYSKETIYQKRNQKTLDEWLGSIEKIKSKIETVNVSQEEKDNLLNELNSYKLTAQSMGKIVIEQKSIETEEANNIVQLREIISRIQKNKKRIVNAIRSDIESLAQNTARTLLYLPSLYQLS